MLDQRRLQSLKHPSTKIEFWRNVHQTSIAVFFQLSHDTSTEVLNKICFSRFQSLYYVICYLYFNIKNDFYRQASIWYFPYSTFPAALCLLSQATCVIFNNCMHFPDKRTKGPARYEFWQWIQFRKRGCRINTHWLESSVLVHSQLHFRCILISSIKLKLWK